MPTGSQHIDFPTSPIRDIKSEMGPPPSLTSPVKRPSTDFAMDNPVGTSPDSSRKRQRFTETPSGDDRAMDISDASTPKITSLSQRVASQASARAASRASASNERFSIYVYPPGGVNAKRKPKTLQVKKTTTVSKIVKSACDAFKFVNKYSERHCSSGLFYADCSATTGKRSMLSTSTRPTNTKNMRSYPAIPRTLWTRCYGKERTSFWFRWRSTKVPRRI